MPGAVRRVTMSLHNAYQAQFGDYKTKTDSRSRKISKTKRIFIERWSSGNICGKKIPTGKSFILIIGEYLFYRDFLWYITQIIFAYNISEITWDNYN